VLIDTERGRDVGDRVPTAAEAEQTLRAEVTHFAEQSKPLAPERIPLSEEMARARGAFTEATRIVRNLMDDIRLGKQVDIAATKPTVEKITASVLRNNNAMMTMRRLRSLDDYTFLHSVSVCAMLASFSKVLDMPISDIHDVALGGLIHDVGKMRVAAAVLHKPSKLNPDEFTHIKSHVVLGSDLVRQSANVPQLALDVLELHHERYDGSGYPNGLVGKAIPAVGRMAAIIDVYDAITSDRVYCKGLSPALAVQKIFEWSKHHFDPEMTQAFLKSIGIYPVGSLVHLESGRLAVVIAQSESHLLTPAVRIIYDAKRQHYITPEVLDLAKPLGAGGGDRITGYELPEKFGIDVSRFLQ
jgi:HD-GYP domain-containing protein (c-di-GMP phosphodiesterase class II)